MAIRIENHCVDCGIHCLGSICPRRRVEVHYCDKCGEELPDDEIYEADDEELCEECLKERFKKYL
jgi:formylmethanofuran dehydrogenase subunit E